MQLESQVIQCASCNKEQPIGFKFCNSCGARNLNLLKKELRLKNKKDWHTKQLAAYSLLVIALLLIGSIPESSLETLLIWTILAAVFDFVFAIQDKSVWELFKWRKTYFKPLLYIIGITITSAIVVSFSMNQLNLYLYGYTGGLMEYFGDLEYPLILAIIIMAFAPAFFEELAFRGFIFNHIRALGGTNAAIYGSAFIFGLVHFSLLSLIWIIPFGIILAYFRKKYDTILLGMIGHFIHNALVMLFEHYGLF